MTNPSMDYCSVIKHETVHNEGVINVEYLESLLDKAKNFEVNAINELLKNYPSISNLTNITRAYDMGKELFKDNKELANNYFKLSSLLWNNFKETF